MKKRDSFSTIVTYGIWALLSLGLVGCSASSGSTLLGKPAPYTKITLLDGDTVTLDTYVGKGTPTVVTFWATTCSYSPRTIERLDAMAQKLKPRGIEFIAVSIDKSTAAESIRNMIKYRNMKNHVHAFSGNDVYDEAYISFDGHELPYIAIIDGAGTIVAVGSKASIVEEYFQLS